MTANRILGVVAAAAIAVFATVFFVPTGQYAYVPNTAKPLADRVDVEGEKPQDDKGGIYYVDVNVRQANWVEWLLPFVRPDGATLVPESELVPPGSTRGIERTASLAAMARSEEVAAAVALREAGYEVNAVPRGTIVEAIAADVPALDVLRTGDVIVEAGGRIGAHADRAARGGGHRAARRVTCQCAYAGTTSSSTSPCRRSRTPPSPATR